MSSEHYCKTTPVFPLAINNRPGLSRVEYRIGDYLTMREHMLTRLNESAVLKAWTNRGSDDPGIAILEGAAMVGDILTFYQEFYGNEAFLRTAAWRESVTDLVRLTGYRLAPGVGGEAEFALFVDSDSPVIIPMGTGFKADLEGQDETSVFETTQEVTAHAALNRFHLYQGRHYEDIQEGLSELEICSVGEAPFGSESEIKSLTARLGHGIKTGDRILLLPDQEASFVDEPPEQKKAEILVVLEVEQVLDRIIIRFEGEITVGRSDSVTAYRIGRTFKHLGHNSPSTMGTLDPATLAYSIEATNFWRSIDLEIEEDNSGEDKKDLAYSPIQQYVIPLDSEVDDLSAGSSIICEGFVKKNQVNSSLMRFAFVKKVGDVQVDNLVWAGLSSSVTMAVLKEALFKDPGEGNSSLIVDIRKFRIHEVLGSPLELSSVSSVPSVPSVPTQDASSGLAKLNFFGTLAEAQSLCGRELCMKSNEGLIQRRSVSTLSEDLDVENKDDIDQWMWLITLDQAVEFEESGFNEEQPSVEVFGNLASANQGKTEAEVVIGSGDNRQSFQSFALPKDPLTYLFDSESSPPQVPELAVYVGGILWKQVDDLFESGVDDMVYVTREDESGATWIQFGDGVTGSRLPSGLGNISIHYRTGVGASGALADGATVSAVGKIPDFDEALMPRGAAGGAAAEEEDTAREVAPVRTQALGRLVSIADFEAEVLAMPGVVKAKGFWALPDGLPVVTMAVLTESGEYSAVEQIAGSLKSANSSRGMNRFPIVVVNGVRQYVALSLSVGYSANRRSSDIDLAIRLALGLTGEEGSGVSNPGGLFGESYRALGLDCHTSQILSAVQNVDGVSWARVTQFEDLDLGVDIETDPDSISIPSTADLLASVPCTSQQVLVLHCNHYQCTLTVDATAEECSV